MTTTVSELKKFAQESGFLDKLKELGFELLPVHKRGFGVYRFRKDYIDYIAWILSSTKNFMYVGLTCTKASILKDYDMKDFPKGFSGKVPTYSATFINKNEGVGIGGGAYKVREKEDLPVAFDEILKQVYQSADPWLKAIDSNEKLYESFSGAFKETEEAQEVKKILSIN